jgi:hypothetical protein
VSLCVFRAPLQGYGEMDVVHRDVLVEKNALVDLHTNNLDLDANTQV